LVTIGGNPVLSVPNSGGRLDEALATLEFMVSVDIYCNETSRHADVILPPPSALEKPHYDLGLLPLAVRNVANYSPAVLAKHADQPAEWEILLRLAAIFEGRGAGSDPAADDAALAKLAAAAAGDAGGPFGGWDPAAVVAALGERRGPERTLDLMLRTGPYRTSLDDLIANPHGIDFGPLEPRLPDALRTSSGLVELAPAPLLADLTRLAEARDRLAADGLVLVGRRHLRTNNSWMGNLEVLVKGKEKCTLQIHPSDAAARGIAPGADVTVSSRVGRVTAPAEITEVVRPGVVSLPHGFGHDLPGVRLAVAKTRPGVNSNLLADDEDFDPLSGTATLNGIPVEVAPA
jgi:anaerobic selenocysteine-containing dehydrogenase